MKNFSSIILRYKAVFIAIILAITVFLGYKATKVQMSYEFARVLPEDDSIALTYKNFKKLFGEDGSVMVVGFNDPDFFNPEKFNHWRKVAADIKAIKGIRDVLSVANLYTVVRNDSLEKLQFVQVVKSDVKSRAEMDSIKEIIYSLPFYDGLIVNKETHTFVMALQLFRIYVIKLTLTALHTTQKCIFQECLTSVLK